MKHIRLPSGVVLNLASVVMLTDDGTNIAVFVGPGPDDTVLVANADAAMLREWMAKRPLLVPPARGKKA